MMSKHTPRPWHVGDAGVGIYDADGRTVAHTNVSRPAKESYANAFLIMAAPDMYYALTCVGHGQDCEYVESYYGASQTLDKCTCFHRLVRTALAKARGEQNVVEWIQCKGCGGDIPETQAMCDECREWIDKETELLNETDS